MGLGWRVGLVVGMCCAGAAAAEEWETVLEEPYLVKTRDVPGSEVKEYRVEGKLRASVADLQAALSDASHFPKFMPHVKEARVLKTAGAVDFVYVRVSPPVGGSRDYVSEVQLLESVNSDGEGRFRQKWRANPDYLPERSGIIRLRINEGSWDISPSGDGMSAVVYRFRVDPGGWVPGFVRELANRQAIPDTLQAIEREAQRRARVRAESARVFPARKPGAPQTATP